MVTKNTELSHINFGVTVHAGRLCISSAFLAIDPHHLRSVTSCFVHGAQQHRNSPMAIYCIQVNPSPRHLDDPWSDLPAEAESITGRALEVLQVDPRHKLVAVLGRHRISPLWAPRGQMDWIPLYWDYGGGGSVHPAANDRRVPLLWGCA